MAEASTAHSAERDETYEALFAENRARYLARLDEHSSRFSIPRALDIEAWAEAPRVVPEAIRKHVIDQIARDIAPTFGTDRAFANKMVEAVLSSPQVAINLTAINPEDAALPIYGSGLDASGPSDGDIVAVTRYLFEHGTLVHARQITGYWRRDPSVAAEPDRPWGSGKAYLVVPYIGTHRIRTEGPTAFSSSNGGYIEYDYVTLVQARHGATIPEEHADAPSLLADWNVANKAAQKRHENFRRSATRISRRDARRRALRTLMGREKADLSNFGIED